MSNSRFSLTEYFTQIGLKDYRAEPTLACLKDIIFHHVITFPYQNSRLFQEGKKPADQRQVASLDPDILFDEVVKQKMPAYCFQNLGLLYDVLTRVGFSVTRHLSKVILTPHAELDPAKIAAASDSHLALIVTIDGCDYLVDTGFANENLRQPLPLSAGKHELEGDDYLLEEFDDHWRVNSVRFNREGQPYWFGLHRFEKKIASNEEIEHAHRDLYFNEKMRIRTDLLLYASVSYAKRKYVLWSAPENHGVFRSIDIDGSVREAKEFTSEAAAVEFAKQKFGLN